VAESEDAATAEEQARFNAVLSELAHHDALVIDTPGHASRLAQFAHAAADVLVTPINDSFIDVDALADIDLPRREVWAPSPYCRSVWRERDRRKLAGEAEVDWLVARNRIGHLDSRSTREMARLLSVLSERLGFRLQPGFSERVIFRELFFRGLTLFDLVDEEVPHGSHASLARARQEVGELLAAVGTSAGRV
jgi:chromosome partitioning protein